MVIVINGKYLIYYLFFILPEQSELYKRQYTDRMSNFCVG